MDIPSDRVTPPIGTNTHNTATTEYVSLYPDIDLPPPYNRNGDHIYEDHTDANDTAITTSTPVIDDNPTDVTDSIDEDRQQTDACKVKCDPQDHSDDWCHIVAPLTVRRQTIATMVIDTGTRKLWAVRARKYSEYPERIAVIMAGGKYGVYSMFGIDKRDIHVATRDRIPNHLMCTWLMEAGVPSLQALWQLGYSWSELRVMGLQRCHLIDWFDPQHVIVYYQCTLSDIVGGRGLTVDDIVTLDISPGTLAQLASRCTEGEPVIRTLINAGMHWRHLYELPYSFEEWVILLGFDTDTAELLHMSGGDFRELLTDFAYRGWNNSNLVTHGGFTYKALEENGAIPRLRL